MDNTATVQMNLAAITQPVLTTEPEQRTAVYAVVRIILEATVTKNLVIRTPAIMEATATRTLMGAQHVYA